jgi:hypothetical protein
LTTPARLTALAWCCVGAAACRTPPSSAGSSDASPAQALPSSVDWPAVLGRCVVVRGYLEGGSSKNRAHVQSGTYRIDVLLEDPELEHSWLSLPPDARIEVQGVVGERADLPVFIQKRGGPVMQGMPVPEGTDLEAARRRFVLERASVTLLRTLPDVEAELAGDLGKDVSLDGMVWSKNERFWFLHDGVELHVDVAGYGERPPWSGLHMSPRTLHGRLSRPADAFVIEVRAVTPHPEWGVTPCADGGLGAELGAAPSGSPIVDAG